MLVAGRSSWEEDFLDLPDLGLRLEGVDLDFLDFFSGGMSQPQRGLNESIYARFI